MRSIHPYVPFAPPEASVLLLGSIPPYRFCVREGLRSHDVDYYYGSADNAFWKLVGEACGIAFLREPGLQAVIQRQEFLNTRRIAVADIILSCERRNNGSSDSDLLDPEYFALAPWLRAHPCITELIFTSQFVQRQSLKLLESRPLRSERESTRIWEGRHIRTTTLYSPSPLALRGLGTQGALRRQEQYRNVFSETEKETEM